jgi:hypothetical protein
MYELAQNRGKRQQASQKVNRRTQRELLVFSRPRKYQLALLCSLGCKQLAECERGAVFFFFIIFFYFFFFFITERRKFPVVPCDERPSGPKYLLQVQQRTIPESDPHLL